MAIGIITGSGTYALPGFEGGEPEPVATRWGESLVSRGTLAGVDVAVAAAVAHRQPAARSGVQQRGAQRRRVRVLVDPVPAVVVARLLVERAEGPVGQPVGEEVQVVEADQRAERDLRVDGPAHRDRDSRAGAGLAQRGDVRAVGDVV